MISLFMRNCLLILLAVFIQQWSFLRADDRVVSWSFGSMIHPFNSSVEFGIRFYAPTIPGNYPVIVYLPGLEGIVPTSLYGEFCTQLVLESNSIIVSFDKLRYPGLPEKMEELFQQTLNWTLPNLDQLFMSVDTPSIISGLVFPDMKTTGVTLMSHSSAAHGIVLYFVKTCQYVDSLILLDPVDGYDPFGLIKNFVTNPPAKLNFTTPTLIAASGLSAMRDGLNPVPCAPKNFSNMRFYDSMAGPTWYMNFTDYGHADILDDWIHDAGGKYVCRQCSSNCTFDLYKNNLAKALSYFLFGLRQKSAYYLNAIQNPSKSDLFDKSIKIEATFDLHGFDVTKTGPFCKKT